MLLFWSVLWTSLNSYPVEIFPISLKKEFNIYDIFKLIFNSRIYIPLIFTNIVLIILLFKIQLFKKNYFLIIYILFFLSQLIGIALYDFRNFNIERIYLVIQAFNALLILYIANNILDEEQIKKFFLINFSFLIIITIIYLPIIYIDYFNNSTFYLYGSQTWSEYFMNENIIRVTGLARIISLIAIILFVNLNNHISNFSKLILIILLIFFGISIWGLQSRLVFLCLTVVLFIYFTLFLRKNILKYFITIFIIIFFSIEGFNTIANFKYLNLDNIKSINDFYTKNQESIKQESIKIEEIAEELEMSVADVKKILGRERRNEESRLKKTLKAIKNGQHVTQKHTVVGTVEYVSSARTLIWNKIIKNYEYKRLFGYGPQADRHVILKIKKNEPGPGGYMSNASSSFFLCFYLWGLFFSIFINITKHTCFIFNVYLFKKQNL
ncbi:O-antigen ligase family protein [Candidatus Pelagibacter sp.]|nr:O-antigen ligase family protein [Candidatus Pelagibacter sp.]